jgi:hypothetical protein
MYTFCLVQTPTATATFTVAVGSKSDLGTYDTELEVTKDSYQSGVEQIDFRVV